MRGVLSWHISDNKKKDFSFRGTAKEPEPEEEGMEAAEAEGEAEQVAAKKEEEPAQEVKSDSMADYYGVMAIPTTILVGKDGKVTSLSARGASLAKQLEELLGPAEQPQPDAEEESDIEGPGAKTPGETE